VVKDINAIETARLKVDPNSTTFQLFTWAQLVIQAHTSPFFITHIHSHTGGYGQEKSNNRPGHLLHCCWELSTSLFHFSTGLTKPLFTTPEC
jgi:hypothetical protein